MAQSDPPRSLPQSTQRPAVGHEERNPACSFCGERKDQVSRVFGGPGVFFCMVCLALVESLIEHRKAPA